MVDTRSGSVTYKVAVDEAVLNKACGPHESCNLANRTAAKHTGPLRTSSKAIRTCWLSPLPSEEIRGRDGHGRCCSLTKKMSSGSRHKRWATVQYMPLVSDSGELDL
eukprot:g28562.t1